LDDYFNAIKVVRVAGGLPLITLLDDAAYVGSSFLCEVSVEVDQKTLTLRFVDLAAVQMGTVQGFVALRFSNLVSAAVAR
jgi:hypothetical protein